MFIKTNLILYILIGLQIVQTVELKKKFIYFLLRFGQKSWRLFPEYLRHNC